MGGEPGEGKSPKSFFSIFSIDFVWAIFELTPTSSPTLPICSHKYSPINPIFCGATATQGCSPQKLLKQSSAMSSPNSSVRKYATPISRRVLTKKLEVLKIAALRNVDTVKEALLVAKKLRHDLEFELLNCPQHDILVAQDLQKLYINSTEISLVLLRVLDEQGIVLIGADEFLPNSASRSPLYLAFGSLIG